MEEDMSYDEVLINEPPNPELLIQNSEPLKIYLEGFPMKKFLDLMKTVKDYGGEISRRVGDEVLILSHPGCSFETESPKFHIKWLYDCINFNKILNASKYLLEIPRTNITHEIKEEDDPLFQPMNGGSKQKNKRSRNIITKSAKYRTRVRKSAKALHPKYSEEENQVMIDYLIQNDAIDVAGGFGIWKKMHKDGKLRHRTVKALSSHFCDQLEKRVRDFTSDQEALRKFQLRKVERQLKRRERRRIPSSESSSSFES